VPPTIFTLENYAAHLEDFGIECATKLHANSKFFLLPIAIALYYFAEPLWCASEYDLYTHRIYPQKFWQYGDPIAQSVLGAMLLVAVILVKSKWLNSRYFMYFVECHNKAPWLIVDGKGLSSTE